jgi:hypothetical protein
VAFEAPQQRAGKDVVDGRFALAPPS